MPQGRRLAAQGPGPSSPRNRLPACSCGDGPRRQLRLSGGPQRAPWHCLGCLRTPARAEHPGPLAHLSPGNCPNPHPTTPALSPQDSSLGAHRQHALPNWTPSPPSIQGPDPYLGQEAQHQRRRHGAWGLASSPDDFPGEEAAAPPPRLGICRAAGGGRSEPGGGGEGGGGTDAQIRGTERANGGRAGRRCLRRWRGPAAEEAASGLAGPWEPLAAPAPRRRPP